MIPVFRPKVVDADIESVVAVLREGWVSSEAPIVSSFEAKFSHSVGVDHTVLVSSGTSALELAIDSLNLKAGDEVVVPDFCIASVIFPLVKRCLKIVFVDCELETYNSSAKQIIDAITPRTRLVIVAHLYGLAVDVELVRRHCDLNDAILLEDAAEAHGQYLNGRPLGSFGHLSVFSFYSNKHIYMGEGGAICTSDGSIAKLCRKGRNLGFDPSRRFIHESVSANYRVTAMQAAFGIGQIDRVDEHIRLKRAAAERYYQYFGDLEVPLYLPLRSYLGVENSFWVFPIRVNCEDLSNFSIHHFATALKERGIETRPMFYSLSRQPFYLKSEAYHPPEQPLSNSLTLYETSLYIPLFPDITAAEQQAVVTTVSELLIS